jgi:translation initiation factor eIF-2B subunit alpha
MHFAETSTRARSTIAELGSRFVHSNTVVLLHGFSRVVLALLTRVVALGTNFSCIVTEGRPDGTGLKAARALAELNIPTTLILDSGVAYAMEK